MIKTSDIASTLNNIEALRNRVRFHLWPKNEAPIPPFVVYDLPDEDSFGADNVRYFATKSAEVHLVTKLRDLSLEQTLEGVLQLNDVYFTKTADYDTNEKVWIINYYFDAL